MTRANFSQATRRRLADSVNFYCVRPGCGRLITYIDPDSGHRVNFGHAAHDSAASKNGPRFDDLLTTEQRRACDNGAWLCAHCATVVDRAAQEFPTGTLSLWQRSAQETLRMQALAPAPHGGQNLREVATAARQFLELVRPALPTTMFSRGAVWQWTALCAHDELKRQALPLIPTNPLSTLYPHTVNVQQRLLDALSKARAEVQSSSCWHFNGEGRWYAPVLVTGHGAERLSTLALVEQSIQLVDSLVADAHECKRELEDLVAGIATPAGLLRW